jgi:hypothetical protein
MADRKSTDVTKGWLLLDVTDDKNLKVRGGTGLFAGRLPLVFFTNMPTNSGMVQGSYAAVTRYNTETGAYNKR